MRVLLLVGIVVLTSSQGFAQTSASTAGSGLPASHEAGDTASLATPTGHDVNVTLGDYTYTEPGAQSVSIHGVKIGGEYTGTFSLDRRRHWFVQANVRGVLGNVTYDGWCSPFLITPDGASPNGYDLDIGDASSCSETGDKDWYLEGRSLVGKDLVGSKWGWSPYSGLGLRHLSNGTNGVPGYRTDNYLYVPAGLTARTMIGSHRVLSFTVEYDRLIHGWQTTRDSDLGGFDVPATMTAPAFSVDSFTDISFSQTSGWGMRASARYQVTRHWSVEPYYVYWRVGSSPVNDETAVFTVNQVTAAEQLGAYEPFNVTHESGVKLGFRF